MFNVLKTKSHIELKDYKLVLIPIDQRLHLRTNQYQHSIVALREPKFSVKLLLN